MTNNRSDLSRTIPLRVVQVALALTVCLWVARGLSNQNPEVYLFFLMVPLLLAANYAMKLWHNYTKDNYERKYRDSQR